MPKFGNALRELMDLRKLTGAAVSKQSGLNRPYVSALLSGKRRVGSKSVAAVMRAFDDEGDQNRLVSAFLEEEVDDVYKYMGGKGAAVRLQQLFTKTLFAPGGPALLDRESRANPDLPIWLEELVVEAVAAGDSDPQVLELIRDLLSAALKHRATSQKAQKRR